METQFIPSRTSTQTIEITKPYTSTQEDTTTGFGRFVDNIDGLATVAYLPDKKLLGLSKLNRIVQFFAKRPQVQERLTEQIRATIQFVAETKDVAVYVDAKHWCVKSRGIQDQTSSTVTLSVGGVFAEDNSEIRKEFLNLARSA